MGLRRRTTAPLPAPGARLAGSRTTRISSPALVRFSPASTVARGAVALPVPLVSSPLLVTC